MKPLLLTFTLLVNLAFSQTPSFQKSPALKHTKAEEVGLSQARLDRIDAMIEEAIESQIIPGAVALVARNGKIVYHKAFGQKNVNQKELFAPQDIFRIASQTKAVTTTAAMMLWEEGKFNLEDPISTWIPAFKNPKILHSFNIADSSYHTRSAEKEITVRQLITHTSGLGYGIIDSDQRLKAIYAKAGIVDLFSAEDVTISENVEKMADLPLLFEPGTQYHYSEGLDVLGYLIEIWSGERFDQYLSNHIFEPLGMKDTHFYLPNSKASRLVPIQSKNLKGEWYQFTDTFYDVNYPKKGTKKFLSGGAGLSSTALDYATFLQMYLNKGELNGIRLLSRNTVNFMLQNQIGSLFGKEKGFGLGFSILRKAGEVKGGLGNEGTFDWGGYFNTKYFADPQEQIIGIILKQTRDIIGDYTSDQFRKLVFQSIDD